MRAKQVALFGLIALVGGCAAYGEQGHGVFQGEMMMPPGPKPGPPRPGPPHPGPPGPGGPSPCREDFFRFCAFRIPDMNNMEDIVKCMGAHLADLNPVCKEMVENATTALAGFHAACDASLTAQCPEAIGNTPHTGMCLVEHLADLEHGCLAEVSKLMMMKMKRHGGRPGPHPMEGHSTGIGSEEFDFGLDFFGPAEGMGVVDAEWRGKSHHFAPMLGCILFGIVIGVMSCCVAKRFCAIQGRPRHGCPRWHPHHHTFPGPHPHPGPHSPHPHPHEGMGVPLVHADELTAYKV